MREILFRGKLTATGEWSEGNLVVNKRGICIITPDETPIGTYGQVDPETVGQYTGLTDKNGKKIFEGDILDCEDRFVVVTWHKNCGCWDCEFLKEKEGKHYVGAVPTTDWKWRTVIVGNIHDNPELLGGEPDGNKANS